MMWFAKNAKGELRVRDYSGFKHTFFGKHIAEERIGFKATEM